MVNHAMMSLKILKHKLAITAIMVLLKKFPGRTGELFSSTIRYESIVKINNMSFSKKNLQISTLKVKLNY